MKNVHTAEAMRTIRERRGLSPAEAAHAAGRTSMYWRQYEYGNRRPTGTTLARLVLSMDLTDDEVLDVVYAIVKDEQEVSV